MQCIRKTLELHVIMWPANTLKHTFPCTLSSTPVKHKLCRTWRPHNETVRPQPGGALHIIQWSALAGLDHKSALYFGSCIINFLTINAPPGEISSWQEIGCLHDHENMPACITPLSSNMQPWWYCTTLLSNIPVVCPNDYTKIITIIAYKFVENVAPVFSVAVENV